MLLKRHRLCWALDLVILAQTVLCRPATRWCADAVCNTCGCCSQQVEVAAAHRGRLSLLVNLLGKPLGALCTEMEGKQSDFRYLAGVSAWALIRKTTTAFIHLYASSLCFAVRLHCMEVLPAAALWYGATF